MRLARIGVAALLLFLAVLPAAAQDKWETHVTQKNGRGCAREGDTIYLVSGGGVVVLDTRTDEDSLLLPIHGLASVDVTSIAIDGSGNKWFGHGDPDLGVSILSADGEWSLFSSFEGLQLGTGDKVNTIFAFGDSVWIGTESGATLFYERERKIIVSQEKEGIVSDNIKAILSAEGRIWLATDQGLSRFSRGAVRNYTVESDGLPSPEILSLAADGQGRVWVGTGEGFVVIEENEVTIPTGLEILAGRRIRSIAFEDSAGTDIPWFATDNGPYRRAVRQITRDIGGSIIEPDEVTQVYVDDENDIWLASDARSLFQWNPALESWHEYYKTNAIQENFVADIAVDDQGFAWCPMVANLEGPNGSPGRRFSAFDGLSWSNISTAVLGGDYVLTSCVAIDSSGNRWFGVRRNALDARTLVRIDASSGIVVDTSSITTFEIDAPSLAQNVRAVFNLEVAPDNSIWAALEGEGFVAFYQDSTVWTSFSHENSCLIYEEGYDGPSSIDLTFGADGRAWFAFQRNRGAWVDYNGTLFDLSDDDCTALSGSNSQLPTNALYTVRADPKGRIWFGTLAGLAMYDPSTDEWKNWNVANSSSGLKDNRCRAIAFDSRGNTWVGTFGGGLSVLLPDLETWLEPWTVSDNQRRGSGITSDQIMSLFIRQNPDTEEEEIWIATWGGGVIRFVVDWTAVNPETPAGVEETPPVVAYPNPYREGEESAEGVLFRDVPLGSTIEIYTLTGEFVKSIDGPIEEGEADPQWDLTNEDRVFIASGVYLFLVKEGGDVTHRGKIAYLR